MKKKAQVLFLMAALSGLVLTGCGPEENISINIAEDVITEAPPATEAAPEEAEEQEPAVTEAEAEITSDAEAAATEAITNSADPSETGAEEDVTEAETAASIHEGFYLVTSNPRPGTAGPEFKPLAGKWEDYEGTVIEFTDCADYEAKFTKTGADGSQVTGKAYIEYSFGTDSYAVYWYNLYSETDEMVYSFRYTGEIPVKTLTNGILTFEKEEVPVTAAE